MRLRERFPVGTDIQRSWGQWPDHEQERDNWRVRLTARRWSPVRVYTKEQPRYYGQGVRIELPVGLVVTHKSWPGTSSVSLRSVDWRTFTLEVSIPGLRLSGQYRWPDWQQTLEDFRADVQIQERLYALYRQAIEGCDGEHEHFWRVQSLLRSDERPPGRPLPEELELVDDQPVIVRPGGWVACSKEPHWIWDKDDAEFLRTYEYSSTRNRRQKEDAERLAEVARSITTEGAA